jgi:hypothetical protein
MYTVVIVGNTGKCKQGLQTKQKYCYNSKVKRKMKGKYRKDKEGKIRIDSGNNYISPFHLKIDTKMAIFTNSYEVIRT